MHFVAIVERRLSHCDVYVPELASGGTAPSLADVQTCATALVVAATGLAPADVLISVHRAVQADTLVRTPPVEVEVRHTDGTWRAAQQIGCVRRRDGEWRPLVCYVADGAAWERAVHASSFRARGGRFPAAHAGTAGGGPAVVSGSSA